MFNILIYLEINKLNNSYTFVLLLSGVQFKENIFFPVCFIVRLQSSLFCNIFYVIQICFPNLVIKECLSYNLS